jgi:hypothetical protein
MIDNFQFHKVERMILLLKESVAGVVFTTLPLSFFHLPTCRGAGFEPLFLGL